MVQKYVGAVLSHQNYDNRQSMDELYKFDFTSIATLVERALVSPVTDRCRHSHVTLPYFPRGFVNPFSPQRNNKTNNNSNNNHNKTNKNHNDIWSGTSFHRMLMANCSKRNDYEPRHADDVFVAGDTSHCVVILGELSVGKSALCRKFFANGYTQQQRPSDDGIADRICCDADDILEELTDRRALRRRCDNNVDEERDCDEDDVFYDEEGHDEFYEDGDQNHHVYERPVTVSGSTCTLRLLDINTERHLIDCCHDDQFANVKSYVDVGDAFIVAYAVTDAGTFQTAKEILEKFVGDVTAPVILVGNKCDLVRKRRVRKSDGIKLAEKYGVKFVETSASLNHNVDDLFEGVIRQMRLRMATASKAGRKSAKSGGSSSSTSSTSQCSKSSTTSESDDSDVTNSLTTIENGQRASKRTDSVAASQGISHQQRSRRRGFASRCKAKLKRKLVGSSRKCLDMSVL